MIARALAILLLVASVAPAEDFRFDAPPGPQFTDEEKQAQRERGTRVLPMVRAAFDAGAATVTIPPGDYRFGRERWEKGGPVHPLEFRGLRREASRPLRIIAEGVTFWFELPPAQAPQAHFALGFVDCAHLSLEGATIDRDPRGCMEGRITQIDDAGQRIEIAPTPGSLIPAQLNGNPNQRLLPFNADGTFCAPLYALQHRPGQLRYQALQPGTQPGRYWVLLDEKSELLKTNRDPAWHRQHGDAGTLQIGDGLSLVHATATAITVRDCTALTFLRVHVYMSKGGIHELHGGGGHVWRHCYFGPRPGTCQWQGSDGFLSGCMERGSLYDGITMLHTTDDVLNIHGYWGYIEATAGRDLTLQRDHQMPAQPGDELHFFHAQTGEPLGPARVEAVRGPVVTLDRDAAPFAHAIAENPHRQCRGWEIRRSTFRDCYQRLFIQGGSGGTLRESTFTRTGSGLSLRSTFYSKNEGGICRDIRILDNVFDRVAPHATGVAILAGFQSLNRRPSQPLLTGLVIRGNRFLHCAPRTIDLALVSGGEISDNTFTPRPSPGTPPIPPIHTSESRDITQRDNQTTPDPASSVP